MHPVVGDFDGQSYFMTTWYMYFPFLTYEVKCGGGGSRGQNAHSAGGGAVPGVKSEKELHREILAFSVSHDHSYVIIYGCYAEF